MDQKVESLSMEIVNPHAAGIDIGSRSHWVSIGQKATNIREFGVFNDDLKAIADWLFENKITIVAIESTGTYWQALYAVLLAHGFQVILCNGKFTAAAAAKNIKGRKTDIQGGRPVIVLGFKNYIKLAYCLAVFCLMKLQNN